MGCQGMVHGPCCREGATQCDVVGCVCRPVLLEVDAVGVNALWPANVARHATALPLQIAERGPLAAALPGDGIDRRLAAAQQAVVDGKLLAAAAELGSAVEGTAAAPVVAAWAAAVKARAAAEQSAALLEAHAAAEAASLA